MKLGFAQCETILNTLPVGYYAGRRVDTTLDAKEPTSFYSPMEDKIVVSYPIIAKRMETLPETADVEEAVRSMLYHEVSHAILTDGEKLGCSDINNIFEDERIETVLKDFYMNTNFKQQLYDICGGTVPKAKDKKSAFFNAVRFRCGTPNIVKRVAQMISDFATLSPASAWHDWWAYENAINRLYDEVGKEFRKNPDAFQNPQNGQGNEGQQNSPDQMKQGNGNGEQQQGKGKQQGQPQSGNGQEGNQSNNQNCGIAEQDSPLTKEEIQKMVGACMSTTSCLSDKEVKQVDDFTKTVETIIGNFNKKNSGGSGINAYSGVFNPRAVARKDYRFFERAMSTQGNNKFGTCHLNLFIDCSGSMSQSEKVVNAMLASLTEVERKNRNFSMDVSFINHDYYDCKTIRERRFRANGGNTIPENMKEIFIKRQLPNTCNYNIVLFDGDALCNEWLGTEEEIRRFGAFDYKQTTLITDEDNVKYLGNGFKNAKVVVTKNYAKELLTHITKALTIAFG